MVASVVLGWTWAAAAPSSWDRVRDPRAARADRLLTMAVRARTPSQIPPEVDLLPEFERLLALRAATLLEMASGEALGGPDVWFFLGDSLFVQDRGREADARRLLLRALDAAPDSPVAAHAWLTVALASNRLHDFEAERAAYGEALRREWDRDRRAQCFMNRGEASMSLRDLRAARQDYLTALGTTDESELTALAEWGLSVVLARDGDLSGALGHAGSASRMQFRSPDGTPIVALDLPGVFYTPAHEIFYYRALGAMAASEHAEGPDTRKAALRAALELWDRYLAGARLAGDPWVSNAEYQRKWCERRLAR